MSTIGELFGARTAVIVPDAIDRALAADVRDRLARAGYARYGLVDRGSYEVARDPAEPALLDLLVRRAAAITGRALAVAEARALRLGSGDYLLAHHDRVYESFPLELVLDLSPASVPGAEVHYRRRGQVFFRFTTVPGALSIVERGPTVTCNHTYVSRLHAGASVIRLVVLLRDAW